MINTGISNLDDKFLSKEDFNEFVDVKMKNNFNSVLNTINTHYNVMIDWQKKGLVVAFIISLMLVLTLITSMIINYSNIKKMTDSIEILTEQMAEQKVQMAKLKEDVAKVVQLGMRNYRKAEGTNLGHNPCVFKENNDGSGDRPYHRQHICRRIGKRCKVGS